MIVKDLERRNFWLQDLLKTLLLLKYPKKLVEDAITTYASVDSLKLRNNKSLNKSSVIPYITIFNQDNKDFYSKVITPAMCMLKNNQKFKEIFSKEKVTCCFRLQKNIGRILFNGANKQEEHGVFNCKDKRCLTCPHLILGNSFNYTNKDGINTIFYINSRLDCNSQNLIYLIKCAGCNKTYVGQTGDTLRHRMTLHRNQINCDNYRHLPISKHLWQCANLLTPNFFVIPFFKIKSNNIGIRLAIERMYIKLFNTDFNEESPKFFN
jgi:hypothetical protein